MDNNSINAANITTIAPSLPEGVSALTRQMAGEWVEGYEMVNLIIPKGVTEIKWHAFEGLKNLAGITIPEGVTIIHRYTFNCCKNLARVSLPENIQEIGERVICALLRPVRHRYSCRGSDW